MKNLVIMKNQNVYLNKNIIHYQFNFSGKYLSKRLL